MKESVRDYELIKVNYTPLLVVRNCGARLVLFLLVYWGSNPVKWIFQKYYRLKSGSGPWIGLC